MLKPAVRRSACDQCRAKRVRCLRAQDSMAQCARCCYMGARCVTGASGHPGRPPKQRLAISSPRPRYISTVRDMPRDIHHVEVHVPAVSVMPTPPEPQPDFCITAGDTSALFDSSSPWMDQSPAPGEDILSLADQLTCPSQFQGLFGADEELNAMLHMGGDSINALDMEFNPLLDHEQGLTPPTPLPQCFSAASSLVRFRKEIDQRIATIDAYYSDTSKVLQHCKDEGAGRDVENPAALLLTCSKELTDIIQSLTPAAHLHTQTEDALSTEIVLLALSSYLALMRLCDSLFHRIYRFLCHVSPDSWKSIKVNSVLRIGGLSSLQDMSLKAYAIGILDAIQGQMQSLERCMGIPAEYCLSGEAAASSSPAAPGIFSRAHRARLFWAVMSQEDIESRRGSKSYVESIRASIKESMAFLDD